MRTVDSCPYCFPLSDQDQDQAACRLLVEITGLDDPGQCRVSRDACAACCVAAEPSPTEWNPVIASLVSRLSDDLIGSGGRPGCSRAQASALRDRAKQSLSVAFPRGTRVSLPPRVQEPCFHLGEPAPGTPPPDDPGPLLRCHHPAHLTTTPDLCHRCRDWSNAPRPAPRPLAELVPAPEARRGPRVERWSVGMTAAPRGEPTWDWALDSLARAGWDAPRLFQDIPVPVARRWAHLPRTVRETRIGAWPNFFLGLIELLLREPDADAYLMVQDDVLLYDRQDLRGYLETVLWPGDPVGLVSLYASSAYTRTESGWHALGEPWVWGALAFVFPRELARRFVADPDVLAHRWSAPNGGLAQIDVVIGRWAARHALPVHFPTPSLAQHVGDVSTIWRTAQALGPRRADRFLGDEPGA